MLNLRVIYLLVFLSFPLVLFAQDANEDLLEAAKREFKEETGVTPTGPFIALTPIKQKGGKIVHA